MDPKERLRDLRETLLATLQGWQADMWTAMPGIIQSVDFEKQSCVVQISVQVSVRDITTGESSWQSISPLLDCPLFFPHGGKYTITFPVTKGDECLVVFASRCIDGWWGNGQVQPQALFRMHDLSDGFVFAGFRSTPSVIPSISSTKLQIRTIDSSEIVELDAHEKQVNIIAGVQVNVTAPDIELNGNVTVTGALLVETGLTAEGGATVTGGTITDTLTVGGHPFNTHIHTGGTLSGGHTGPPV